MSQVPLEPLERRQGEPDADYTQRLRYSARGYKGHLTRAVKKAENILSVFIKEESSFGVFMLKETRKEMEDAFQKLQQRCQELMEISPDEKQYKAYEDDLVEYDTLYMKC